MNGEPGHSVLTRAGAPAKSPRQPGGPAPAAGLGLHRSPAVWAVVVVFLGFCIWLFAMPSL